jgi:hypothetical protein
VFETIRGKPQNIFSSIHHYSISQLIDFTINQGGIFFERDGRPYCEADFYRTFAPKCGGCNEPIRGDCINALGSQWHPEHFACTYCQKAFG